MWQKNKKMKAILVQLLLYNLHFFGYTTADNNGNCDVTDISGPEWNTKIINLKDTDVDATVFQSKYSGTLEVESYGPPSDTTTTDVTDYFNITSDDENFIIKTTAKMADFDKNTPKQSNAFSANLVVNIKCAAGTSSLILLLNIQDVNSHLPTFDDKTYTYDVASPIMPLTDFTVYGSSITATDLDFSNQNIVFTIEPNHFDISTIAGDNKTYTAVFKTKVVLQITDDTTYTLIATDDGTPPLNSSVSITLKPDLSLGLDSPYFSSSSYTFDYTIAEGKAILTPIDEQIIIHSNKLTSIRELPISGDNSDFVTATLNSTTGVIDLLSDPFTSESSVVSLTLSVKTDNLASTLIIFNMPVLSIEFDNHVYTGDYNPSDNTVALDENITVTYSGTTSTPTVEITGDLAEKFNVAFDGENKHFAITVIHNLTSSDLKNMPIKLTITASLDEKTDTADVLIYAPSASVLKFTKALYSAKYDVENNKVEVNGSVGFVNDADNINVTVDSYSENFQVKYNATTNDCSIEVRDPLPDNILKSQTEVVLTLTAKDIKDPSSQSQAVLEIALPQGPLFKESYYTAVYPEDNEKTIDFESAVEFDNVNDPTQISIILDNYQPNFKIEFNENWQITIKEGLNKSVLENHTELNLVMTASQTGKVSAGRAVLILKLPGEKVAPTFASAFYVTDYSKDGAMYFKPPIEFVNADANSLSLSVIGEYQENFKAESRLDKWQLTTITPLNISVISLNRELVMTLEASQTGKTVSSSALVIKLPTLTSPQFSKSHYSGNYTVSGEVVLDDDVIRITTDDPDDTQVTADSLADILNLDFNKTTGECTISVSGNLNDAAEESKELLIGLSASDSIGQGTSSLLLRLPSSDPPRFSRIHYEVEYNNKTGVTTLDNPIQINNRKDLSKLNVSLEEDTYSTNFKVVFANDKASWKLEVISLPRTTEAALTMTLIVEEVGNTQYSEATLVFKMPTELENLPPKFSKSHYSAYYTSDGEITSDVVEVTSKNSGAINLFLSDYSSNFKFVRSGNTSQWTLKTAELLPEEVLNENIQLVLTLTASEDDNINVGEATLIIYLPSDNVTVGDLTFSEVHYEAEYNTSGAKPVVILEKNIVVTSASNLLNLSVNLTSEAGPYFFLKSNDEFYTVEVGSPLPNEILQNERTLIYTIKAEADERISFATLVINLPSLPTSSNIQFSNILYSGRYVADDTGFNLTTGEIILVTDESEEEIEIDIAESEYKSHFSVSLSGKMVSVVASDRLPSDISNSAVITLLLVASVDDVNTTAVLNIEIVNASDNTTSDSIEFENILYTGQYFAENGSLIVDPMNLITGSNSEDIKVAFVEDNDISSLFKLTCADKRVSVDLADEPLSDIVVEGNSFLSLSIEASITGSGSTASAQAVLNILIVKPDTTVGFVRFPNLISNGTYQVKDEEAALSLDPIALETDQTEDKIDCTIIGEYGKYFDLKCSNKSITLETGDVIPSNILSNLRSVMLEIRANIKDSAIFASTVVNLEVIHPDENSTANIAFDNVLYTGYYYAQNESITVDTIKIITDQADGDYHVTINKDEFSDLFNVTTADKTVTVTVRAIPDSVVDTETFIPLTLNAVVTGSTTSTSAVLNVIIVSDNTTSDSIEFENILYTGQYFAENESLIVDPINLITGSDSKDIKVAFVEDNDISNLFKLTYADKSVSVDLADESLSDIVVEGNSFLSLRIEASITGSTASAQAVLNIVIVKRNATVGFVRFPNLISSGTYQVEDEKAALSLGPIALETDQTEDKINFTIIGEYGKYFNPKYSNKSVTLETGDVIPSNILSNLTSVILEIRANIKDSAIFTSTVVNLEVIHSDENPTENIAFDNVRYTGYYYAQNRTLTVDAIKIISDKADGEYKVTIEEDEFSDLFSVTIADKTVTVATAGTIPDSVVDTAAFIPLTLNAVVTGSTANASAVLNVIIVKDGEPNDNTTGYIYFSELVYSGTYQVKDDEANLTLETITLNTDQPDENIEISLEGDYSTYFNYDFGEKKLSIKAGTLIPSDILSDLSSVLLVVTASIKNTPHTDSTVVNLAVISDPTSPMLFSKILYTGEYFPKNSSLDIKGGIQLNTDAEVDIRLSNDDGWNKYFNYEYSNGSLTIIVVDGGIPDDILKDATFISLTISAKIAGTDGESFAVLTLSVDHEGGGNGGDGGGEPPDFNKTGYVVAVSILSVLILLLVVAAFAFYYFRLRAKDYTEVDEEVWKVRFAANSEIKKPRLGSTNTIERRPTGFVFNHLEEEFDEPGETTTDPERRKSVVFDSNVEKLQFDPVSDDDTNEKNEIGDKATGNSKF